MIPVELGLPAFLIALTAGLGSGAISVWIFKRMISPDKFRFAYNHLLAHLLEFRLFADEPAVLLHAQWDLLRANAILLRQSLMPSMVLAVPVALLMIICEALLGHAPLRPGDAAVITLRSAVTPSSLQLIAPAGFTLETPPVWIPLAHEVSWRVRPLNAATGELQAITENKSTKQAIFAGTGPRWIWSLKSPFAIDYPDATVFGVSWLVWFFAGSLTGSLVAFLGNFQPRKASLALAAFVLTACPLKSETVSPLFARGYSVLPQPQTVTLTGADFQFNSAWGLRIDTSVAQNSGALASLRDGLQSRFKIDLQPSSTQVLELAIQRDSVQPGPSQDKDRQQIAKQAYRLELHASSIRLTANEETGLFYGVQTLLQLIKANGNGFSLPEGEIVDWPDMQMRQIYWDDAHHLEKLDVLKDAVRQASFFKINGFIIKLEGHFQFQHAPAVVEPQALSPAEFQELTDYGALYHVQVIPYLDAPGHLAFLLKHPEYAPLREFPDSNYELCVVNPDALQLLYGMYDDLLAANKGTRYFYLSTDEAYYVGLSANSQCDEAGRAKQLGSRGKLLAEFVTKAAGYLHDRGRTVVFWGEYPLKVEDIGALPPFVINGETVGEKFDPLYRQQGIRQMIYQATEGEEPLFPHYFLLPQSRRLQPIQEDFERVSSDVAQIAADPARQNSDLMGLVVAGWGDIGVHPSTFWLGYATITASGWHLATAPPAEAMASFYPLYFGPNVRNMDRVYQLLSYQSQVWSNTWDTVDSKIRTPIWGDSDHIFKSPHFAHDQTIALPAVPNDDLQLAASWTSQNAKRLSAAQDAKAESDELMGLLHENLRLASMNLDDLKVFLSIARICRQNLDLLSGFARIDSSLSKAAMDSRKGASAAALSDLDSALDEARSLKRARDRVFNDTVQTWYEGWLPRLPAAHGKVFLHAVDDVKDHLPDRTTDMSYLIYRELNLPVDDWYQRTTQARNTFAATHHLPARTLPLAWKDTR